MLNFTQNIVQMCAKAVHKSSTSCGYAVALSTQVFARTKRYVHNPSSLATSFAPVMRPVMPKVFGKITSVAAQLIPTFHTTYKENDKPKVLKFHIINTGASL